MKMSVVVDTYHLDIRLDQSEVNTLHHLLHREALEQPGTEIAEWHSELEAILKKEVRIRS